MFLRIYALMDRYKILIAGSIPRLISVFWWPSIQIVLWGFFSSFLATQSNSLFSSVSVLLSAVILWDVLFRGQLGLSITFFEELWSRNLTHLFITPIKNHELILSLLITSFLRTLLGLIPAILISNYYFELSFFNLGFYLISFFFNLIITGWAIGLLVSGLVLRYGQSFEELAWAFIFLLLPFSCVYYPLESLPQSIQFIANLIPPVHIFEGMRSIIMFEYVDYGLLQKAFFLNLLYLMSSTFFFNWMIDLSKKNGKLMNFGE